MKFKYIFYIISFLLLQLSLFSKDETQTHEKWDAMLKKYVKDNKVDYIGINSEIDNLKIYLNNISKIKTELLSENEFKALTINAYNAYTVLLILENDFKNLKSIKDIPNAWDIKFCKLSNQTYSLNELENNILRKNWSDPRIHFAINCASNGCPPLQPFAFTAIDIEKQLEIACQSFINSQNCIKIENDLIKINPIFLWYKSDFEKNDNTISKFLLLYLQKPSGELVKKLKNNSFTYFDYDWLINKKITN